jgi:PBP1b-binding outer membrane lipoprotein LpoB
MKKTLSRFLLAGVILAGCSSDAGSDPKEKVEEKAPAVEYKVVEDEKFAKTEQRQIRVTTEASSEADYEDITEKVMDEYKDMTLDSIHLYIHAPNGDSFGELKAHSFIAYSQKGAAQVGVDKAKTYKIEINE